MLFGVWNVTAVLSEPYQEIFITGICFRKHMVGGSPEGKHYRVTFTYEPLCRQLLVSFHGKYPKYLGDFHFYPYEIAHAIPDVASIDNVSMQFTVVSINHEKTYFDAAVESVISKSKRIRKTHEPANTEFAEIFAQLHPKQGEQGPTFDLRLKIIHVANSIIPGDRSFRLELEAISLVEELHPAVTELESVDEEMSPLEI